MYKSLIVLMLILGFSVGATTGCGPAPTPTISVIAPTFFPYYTQFSHDYNMLVFVPIDFSSSLDAQTVGKCDIFDDGHRQIEINRTFWNNATEITRIHMIYHELGHCVFGRIHTSEKLSDGCPSSIMYPTTFTDTCMIRYSDQYKKELPQQ